MNTLDELKETQRVAHIGSWYWDAETDENQVSEELCRIFGWDAAPPFAQQSGTMYPPETWQQLNAAVQETVRTGTGYNLELPALRGDGTPIWINTRGEAVRDAHDKVVGLRGTVQDITERKIAERALQVSEERYRTLFESIDEGFCILEMIFDEHEKPVDWLFLEVNPSFENQTGLHDIVGKRMRELAPDHEAHWFETYGKVALTGEPIRFVNEAKALDGRWFDLYAFRVGGLGSHKVAVLFTNITERKRLDQALQDQNAELESARLLAEKASFAKSAFLSSMSHELRTPLNAILGFAQLLEAGSPPPTAAQLVRLHQIIKAGWYLLELINEILDLAVIESGKLSLSGEPVSLIEVLQECQAMIEPQAQQRGIHIDLLPFDHSWFVNADRTRVKQVLVNLLSNAVKYNREQGTVEVKCTARTPERIRISIKDSGVGLSVEKMAQLFQPFNRLGQEAGTEEGTGSAWWLPSDWSN